MPQNTLLVLFTGGRILAEIILAGMAVLLIFAAIVTLSERRR